MVEKEYFKGRWIVNVRNKKKIERPVYLKLKETDNKVEIALNKAQEYFTVHDFSSEIEIQKDDDFIVYTQLSNFKEIISILYRYIHSNTSDNFNNDNL